MVQLLRGRLPIAAQGCCPMTSDLSIVHPQQGSNTVRAVPSPGHGVVRSAAVQEDAVGQRQAVARVVGPRSDRQQQPLFRVGVVTGGGGALGWAGRGKGRGGRDTSDGLGMGRDADKQQLKVLCSGSAVSVLTRHADLWFGATCRRGVARRRFRVLLSTCPRVRTHLQDAPLLHRTLSAPAPGAS